MAVRSKPNLEALNIPFENPNFQPQEVKDVWWTSFMKEADLLFRTLLRSSGEPYLLVGHVPRAGVMGHHCVTGCRLIERKRTHRQWTSLEAPRAYWGLILLLFRECAGQAALGGPDTDLWDLHKSSINTKAAHPKKLSGELETQGNRIPTCSLGKQLKKRYTVSC